MITTSVGALSALLAAAASGPAQVQPPAPGVVEPEPATPPAADKKLTKAALQQEKAKRAIKVARKQLGDPYVWGAAGPHAFDCSGLIQFAWRKAGVKLPRTTWSMLKAVKKKVSLARLKPGDLIFTNGGGHMGMYVGHKKVIHAPHSGAVVRIDRLKDHWRSSFLTAVRPGV
ncbi:hypothetical protein GCM10010116_61300 [Microbispora rosea subsp. aerata]|nr:C40 family peptidase [Microbispora rosea]GGO30614.1 hypothetical protein GCM10010116_61300 [Microbispora rosea subsp. aerata]GIH59134.1 hypothetical protein Mro02_60480 [Microbispora rosea subsp. aerata]GLJ86324.1 hypothetical protein GCM10017588_50590 [Microbispora rosea subsp. aerata]